MGNSRTSVLPDMCHGDWTKVRNTRERSKMTTKKVIVFICKMLEFTNKKYVYNPSLPFGIIRQYFHIELNNNEIEFRKIKNN